MKECLRDAARYLALKDTDEPIFPAAVSWEKKALNLGIQQGIKLERSRARSIIRLLVMEIEAAIRSLQQPVTVSDEMRERVARALATQDLRTRHAPSEQEVPRERIAAIVNERWRDWLDDADAALTAAFTLSQHTAEGGE